MLREVGGVGTASGSGRGVRLCVIGLVLLLKAFVFASLLFNSKPPEPHTYDTQGPNI